MSEVLPKKRIYEIARELGVASKELIARLDEMGMPGLKAANSVDEEECALIVNLYQDEEAAPPDAQPEPQQDAPPEEPAEEVAASEEKPAEKRAPRVKATGDPRPPIVSVLGHIERLPAPKVEELLKLKESFGLPPDSRVTEDTGLYVNPDF